MRTGRGAIQRPLEAAPCRDDFRGNHCLTPRVQHMLDYITPLSEFPAMSAVTASIRFASVAIVLSILGVHAAHAQATAAAKSKHPVVCAKGVRVYTDRSQIPTPHDTVAIPPAAPIRITSPDEAEAAEMALRERAGSVGANSVLLIDEVSGDADAQRVRRTATGLFVPADSARALQACK